MFYRTHRCSISTCFTISHSVCQFLDDMSRVHLDFLGRGNRCVLALLSYQRSRTQSRPTCGFGKLGLCPASHQQYFSQESAGILKKRSARRIILFGSLGQFATAAYMQYASVDCETSSIHRSFMTVLRGHHDESHTVLSLYLSEEAAINKVLRHCWSCQVDGISSVEY